MLEAAKIRSICSRSATSAGHFAPVRSVEPYKDTGKYLLQFAEPAKAIGPLPLIKNGIVRALQAPRYTTHDRLFKAKTMADVFAPLANNANAVAPSAL